MASLVFVIILGAAGIALLTYFSNRSRCLLEQAVQLSECTEEELRELIREGVLSYRRQYLIFGPLSFDTYQLADVRAHYPELKRLRAEHAATLQTMAEEMAASIAEANRRYQEEASRRREEQERMERVYAALLHNLSIHLNLMPPAVAQALDVLGLPRDASLREIRQCYRELAKRYHPDTGGDAQQFIRVNDAYTCVIAWIDSQR